MDVEFLAVPYDSGLRGARMGAGPQHLLDSELGKRFPNARTRLVELPNELFPSEATVAFALARGLSTFVRDARERKAFPLVLSGNCGVAALGTISGLGGSQTGIVWFDAHADFNTPESTPTGFLDGMALSIVTGNCWRGLAATISGFRSIPENKVVLIGARELDPGEANLLAESRIAQVTSSSMETAFDHALDSLSERVSDVYVHVDLDVIDSNEGRANTYACRGGLWVSQVLESIENISRRFSIRAAALTSYDPAVDQDHRIQHAAGEIASTLVRLAKN
jgi:arginase